MELSESVRLILSNQYMILEKLYPDDEETYKRHREIIERGYTLNYEEISTHIYDELNEGECTQVLDILSMHRSLLQSAQALEDQSPITIRFPGFDGNSETKQMAYTRFYIDDLHRFSELTEIAESPDYDSHRPTLRLYRLMLDEWNNCDDKNNLSRENIERIVNVIVE